jgi:DNA-binding protein WhiA
VARLAVRLDPVASRDVRPFDWASARGHCRAAHLRGRFLARGSLSLGAGSTHLEFVLPVDEAADLAGQLGQAGMRAAWRVRRGRGVVTWKSSERVLTFLRFLGASSSVLELEARLVTHQLRGHLNRVLNAETSNVQRSVAANARQLMAIERLAAAGRLADLPELDQRVASARREAPDASMTELAERLEVTRSRVQRTLARLESSARAAHP